MKIELNSKEVEILIELLSLDQESIGFEDDEQTVLENILDKLTNK